MGLHFQVSGFSENDHIYKIVYETGTFYEIDLLEYIRFIVRYQSEAIAIDVGANIGNHSIYFSTFVTGATISIEPNPDILDVLNENLEANCNEYVVYELAVGEAPGIGRIVIPADSIDNVGMAQVHSVPGPGCNVRISTIDEIIENYDDRICRKSKIALIKLDIEGMEVDALRGARNTLLNQKPELFIEAQTIAALERLKTFLSSYGYEAISRWGATPVYHFSPSPSAILRARVSWYRARRKALRGITLFSHSTS